MNLLYNLGIHLYRLAVNVVAPRNRKAAKMLAGQRDTFERLRRELYPDRRYVWIHAASLGEFEQGRPFMERLRHEHPELGIVLTFFSPSGYEVRRNYNGADVVCYLPFDTIGNARTLVDIINPAMAVFIKYEFWGNYLQELNRRGVPIYLISAIFRDDQAFFKWWGHQFRKMLRFYTHIFVQDEASLKRLAQVGVNNVSVAGDTRFDRVTDILNTTVNMPEVEKWKGEAPMTLVVGSSWEADEEFYIPWLNAHPEVKVIIAPHEFDEERLQRLEKAIEGGVIRLSQLEKGVDDSAYTQSRALLIDCFGKLASLYRYGDVAYIGGGFGEGIHNINEAAVYGIPVVFGPRHHKFKEATDLIACGGGHCVSSPRDVDATLSHMLSNPDWRRQSGDAAAKYILANLGATKRIFDHIFICTPDARIT